MDYLFVDKIKEITRNDLKTVGDVFRESGESGLETCSDLLEQDVKNSVKTFDNFFKEYNENFSI